MIPGFRVISAVVVLASGANGAGSCPVVDHGFNVTMFATTTGAATDLAFNFIASGWFA